MAWQITKMAADIVECCTLGRRVALRLAEALTNDTHREATVREGLSHRSFGKDARSTTLLG